MTEIIDAEFDLIGDLKLPVITREPQAQALIQTPAKDRETARENLSWAISQLMLQKVESLGKWLDDVGKVNPKDAIELYQSLTEFTLPRLKAASINVNANVNPKPGRPAREMTVTELESIARGDS